MPIEDLRDLSRSQCHEPVDFDEDWLVCFFGAYPSQSSRPKAKEQTTATAEDKATASAAAEKPAQAGDQPTALKPHYDSKKIYDKLPKLAATDVAKAKRLLLGLHERMWR